MDFKEFLEIMKFNNSHWQVLAVLGFTIGDIITGVIQGIINNEINTEKIFNGLLRKILLYVILGLSYLLQYAFFNMKIVSKVVSLYIIFMEIISILENLKRAGIDMRCFYRYIKNKEGR